jgi:uncharacterized protein (TIGR00730 family)
MDNNRPAICVFCGSSHGRDAAYASAARRMGTLIGENGYDLVFGGGYIGLMGEVARAARESGAFVTGVMPDGLRHLEPPMHDAQRVLFTPDLFERKRLMMSLSDAIVVLPGGLGTLDEFFEAITAVQLGFHTTPIVLLNTNGYWNPLLRLFEAQVHARFVDAAMRDTFATVNTAEEAIAYLGTGMASVNTLPR